MWSAVTFLVLGQAYFATTAPNYPSNGSWTSDATLDADQQPQGELPTSDLRLDYTYTPGIGGHKVHGNAARWADARAVCKSEGGDLAIVNSKAESEIIVHLLEESKPHNGSFYDHDALIGFSDLRMEGRYETIDGKPLSESGFYEWGQGEPNNGNGGQNDCGAIQSDGKLNDANCLLRFAFVCELPEPVLDPEIQAN